MPAEYLRCARGALVLLSAHNFGKFRAQGEFFNFSLAALFENCQTLAVRGCAMPADYRRVGRIRIYHLHSLKAMGDSLESLRADWAGRRLAKDCHG